MKITVAIPCYNYGRYLNDAIDAAWNQDGVNVDIVVVDDASLDETWEVARRAGVRYVRNEQNEGNIFTYNRCIAESQCSDAYTMVSADDILAPGALSRALDVLERAPAIGLVYGHVVEFQDGIKPVLRAPPLRTSWRTFDGRRWNSRMCRVGRNFVTACEAVVRTSVQQAVGLYNPRLLHTADMEMWMRIAAVSDVAYIRGADQACYRKHPAQMTHQRNDLQARWETFAELRRQGIISDEDFTRAERALNHQGEDHHFKNRILRHLQWRWERATGEVCR